MGDPEARRKVEVLDKTNFEPETFNMTTDTKPKHALVRREGFTIGAIAKGSGMKGKTGKIRN